MSSDFCISSGTLDWVASLCASIIDAPISLLDCCQRQFKRWNNQTNSQNQQIKFKMSVHNMELNDEKNMF